MEKKLSRYPNNTPKSIIIEFVILNLFASIVYIVGQFFNGGYGHFTLEQHISYLRDNLPFFIIIVSVVNIVYFAYFRKKLMM